MANMSDVKDTVRTVFRGYLKKQEEVVLSDGLRNLLKQRGVGYKTHNRALREVLSESEFSSQNKLVWDLVHYLLNRPRL